MVVSLPPDLERLVQRQVESGKYATAIEALLAGMHLLDQQEDDSELENHPGLKRAIAIGWEASQPGEVIDGPIAMNQILEDLRSRHCQRASMNPQFRPTQPAMQDIQETTKYLPQNFGFSQAERLVQKLNIQFSRIVQFPQIGKPRNDLLLGSRTLLVDQHLIFIFRSEMTLRFYE